jgi:hypothetical protein
MYKIRKRLADYSLSPVLVTAVISYLIITPADAILYLQWINSMYNYKWIAGGLIFPVFGFLFFAVPTAYKLYKKEISTDYPTRDLAMIGFMDSTASIMAALTIPYISIMLNVVVSKLVLPITMVLSFSVLGTKYFWQHYAGVGMTIFGVLVAAVPKMVMSDENTDPLAMIIFIFSLVPSVASFIIKEMYLKKYPTADAFYMNTVISMWQVIIGLVTLPLAMLPLPGREVTPSHFGSYISNSLKCQLGGINSKEDDDCEYAFMYLMLFQIFGTIANILMFTIIREGSSVMFIMANTLKTPITALMGFFLIYYNYIKFTEGESFVLTWLDVVSLILVVIGSLIYASKPELTKDKQMANNLDKDGNEEKTYYLNPLLADGSDDSTEEKSANL